MKTTIKRLVILALFAIGTMMLQNEIVQKQFT